MILGDIIKSYRKEHNIDRKNFARMLEVPEGYLFFIEENKAPDGGSIDYSYHFICSAAELMGLKVSELVRMMEDE